jgi:hypothetical protein
MRLYREGMGEALTGDVRAGLLSRERSLQGADAVLVCGRLHQAYQYCEMRLDPAWSKTPSRSVSSLRGNREIPRLALGDGTEVRAVNPEGARQQ